MRDYPGRSLSSTGTDTFASQNGPAIQPKLMYRPHLNSTNIPSLAQDSSSSLQGQFGFNRAVGSEMSLLGEGGASVGGYANALLKGPGVLLAVLRSKLGGNGEADAVMRYVLAEQSTHQSGNLPPKPPQGQCRLYGWELSYFTGKVRGYLRYKARHSRLQFEEIVADPAVVKDVLVPATGSTLGPPG